MSASWANQNLVKWFFKELGSLKESHQLFCSQAKEVEGYLSGLDLVPRSKEQLVATEPGPPCCWVLGLCTCGAEGGGAGKREAGATPAA